jgi:type IV pilus assembly protein PilB
MNHNYYPFGIPFIPLENYNLDINIVKIIPKELAICYEVIALEKWETHKNLKSLTVGMVNPENYEAIKKLEEYLDFKIHSFKVEKEILIKKLEEFYNFNSCKSL